MPPVPPILYTRTTPSTDWKGPTYHQVAPSTVFNQIPPDTQVGVANLYRALPVKHYRRELPGTNDTCTNAYHNPGRMRDINRPGGTVTHSAATQFRQDTVAPIIPPSEICSADSVCLSAQANARRRARSSGMIRKNTSGATPTYYTTASQRLYGRNKTYEQNQITLMREGDATIIPGNPGSYENVYASGTAVNCPGTNQNESSTTTSTYIPVYYKPSNSRFSHQGAVSANERSFRLKYDAIMAGGQVTNTPYGLLKPAEFAYAINGHSYRLKDKIGVDAPLVPTFTPYSSEMKTCASSRFH